MRVNRIFPVLFVLLFVSALQAVEIRIAASDLLADCLRPSFESFEKENEVEVKFEAIGSLPAMDRLYSDEIDMAIIALPEDSELPREDFRAYPLAYDSSIIITAKSNPIDEINLAQLGGIFGTIEDFSFDTWGDLGQSVGDNRNIRAIAGVKSESISLELFRHTVLSEVSIRNSVSVVRADEVEKIVAADATSIAITSGLPENQRVKTLMVSRGGQEPAFGPSRGNIHFGDYPIRLSFFVLFDPRDAEKLNGIIRALLSDSVAENLEANDFFSLPATVRQQFLTELEFDFQTLPED